MDHAAFETDDRSPPDEYRQRNFKMGWQDATSGKEYTEDTLKRLTWHNLGYRMGRIFGDTEPDTVVRMYEWCAEHYRQYGQLK